MPDHPTVAGHPLVSEGGWVESRASWKVYTWEYRPRVASSDFSETAEIWLCFFFLHQCRQVIFLSNEQDKQHVWDETHHSLTTLL